MKIKLIHSIKSKLIILVCAMSLLSLMITGTVLYYFVYNISKEKAKDYLQNETKLISLRFSELFRTTQNDGLMLLKTPPVQGIIRSQKNNNIDLLGKSTFSQWQDRLENIFVAVMQNNRSYMQIRYIGIKDNGKELVRVNRDVINKDVFIRVEPDKLQSKNKEPYFIDSLKLMQGDIYISSITYNRELGEITSDKTSMMRVVVPVFDENTLFGFIVINVDYQKFFINITNQLSPSTNLMVINNDKSYFECNFESKKYSFTNKDDFSSLPSKYIHFGQVLNGNNGSYTDRDTYTYYTKTTINDKATGGIQYFFTALQIKNSDLFLEANHLLTYLLLLMVIIALLKLIISYLFANMIISPLSKITDELRQYSPARSNDLQLPMDRQDEIGLLARTFKDMINEIEQFVYTVSHDLKQPLRNIASYISFIKMDYYDQLDDNGKSHLEGIEKSINRMHTLLTELLAYTRIGYDNNKIKLDLNETLLEVIEDLDSQIKSNNVSIAYDHLPIIIGNKIEIHSLFQNLIDNAIKYRKKDIDPKIEIRLNTAHNRYTINFIDNGLGIDEQYHHKVFELFQRIVNDASPEGTGIGLAHCKKIVEKHHGTIELKSKKNEGCIFIINLPIDKNIQ